MDQGLIRRMANLCKTYYTIRTIDDLFRYSGAKQDWWLQVELPGEGERIHRFYGWVEGINNHNPTHLDTILDKVVSELLKNTAIPKEETSVLYDALLDMQQTSVPFDLEAVLSSTVRLLAAAGLAREVAIVTYGKPHLIYDFPTMPTEGDHDIEVYRLFFQVPVRLFAQLEPELVSCQHSILDRIRQVVLPFARVGISEVLIAPAPLPDEKWRERATAWLAGEGVNNQGRVRSDNVAPMTHDGLQFRSQEEVHLYGALKAAGVSFAPLPVFLRGGKEYRRIEPDFVIIKDGIVMVVEVDGDTVHHESPAEADTRTTLLENEGVHVLHIKASECRTLELATQCAKRILDRIARLKEARR